MPLLQQTYFKILSALLVSALAATSVQAGIYDRAHIRQSPFLATNPNSTGFVDSIINACGVSKLKKRPAYKQMIKQQVEWKFPQTLRNGDGKFFTGSLFLQRDGAKRVRNADFTVISPGIFTGYDDTQAAILASYYYEVGHHVLVLPSPWSLDYVQNSNFKMGSLKTEANLFLGMLRNVQTMLRSQRALGRTNITAYSYGSYIAAYSGMIDAKSTQPTVDGKIVLVSPPFDMKQNLDLMDKVLTNYLPVAKASNILKMLTLRNRLCGDRSAEYAAKPEAQALAAGIVAKFIFKWDFDKSMKAYEDRVRGTDDFSSFEMERGERRLFRRALSFRTYVDRYYPEMFNDYPSRTNVTAYIDASEQRMPGRFRVIVATNDFINPGNAWGKVDASYVLKLGQGGHVMFIFNDWSRKLLQDLVK